MFSTYGNDKSDPSQTYELEVRACRGETILGFHAPSQKLEDTPLTEFGSCGFDNAERFVATCGIFGGQVW
jgi:hypothetical protein